MTRISDISGICEQARLLRATLSMLLGMSIPENIILSAGTTVGLRLIFAGLRIEKLIIGTDEYCSAAHFWPLDVSLESVEGLEDGIEKVGAQAILMSIVSWRGKRFPIGEVFGQLRAKLGDACPLLIADYSHGGADGFPSLEPLNADIIIGDFSKWLLVPHLADELCFMYPTNSKLSALCQELFCSMFLATQRDIERSARWIIPDQISRAVEFLRDTTPTRESLGCQHALNISFKQRLLKSSPAANTATCMVWFAACSDLPRWLCPDLVWRTPQGIRVLCREDVQLSYEKGSVG